MIKTKIAGLVFTGVAVAVLASSCSKVRREPGWQWAPQMYASIPYEPDQVNPVFENGLTAQVPPTGTVQHDKSFYFPFAKDDSAFFAAGKAYTENPIKLTTQSLAEGKSLYEAMCSHCHGNTGMGDGAIVVNGTYPAVPPKFSDNTLARPRTGGPMTEYTPGMIFHTITYGYNLMGAHASQITPEERWKIILYVQQLQNL